MMSGHATIDTAVRAVRVGALNFLEKPLNTDALLIAVETALRLTTREAEARDLRRAAGTTGELVGDSPAMKKLVEQNRARGEERGERARDGRAGHWQGARRPGDPRR